MSTNALRLPILNNCFKNAKPKDNNPPIKTSTLPKDILAQREAQYDKNLKSIIKLKPTNDENIRGSMNTKPTLKRNFTRDRSRSVKTKPVPTKSTPREPDDLIPTMNSKTFIMYKEVNLDKTNLSLNEKSISELDKSIKAELSSRSEFKFLTKGDDKDIDFTLTKIQQPDSLDLDDKGMSLLTKSLSFDRRTHYLPIFQENINRINLGIFYNLDNTDKDYSSNFTTGEYRRLVTTLFEYEYGKSILENLINDQQVIKYPLERHKITERMRAKMIDWIIEVLGNYNCDDNTFFLAVNIMDKYFQHSKEVLKPEDIHLIGVCSMFIASKFYEILPIKLKMMSEKVSHGKFLPDDIKRIENRIIKTIGHSISSPTVHDFITHYVEQIFYFIENSYMIQDENLLDYIECIYDNSNMRLNAAYYEKCKMTRNYSMTMLNLLNRVLVYLSKMTCYDYNLIGLRPSLVAAACLLVALKICEEIDGELYVNGYFMNKLSEISGHCESDIITHSQRILYNAQSFDALFTGLPNLKKKHFIKLEEL
jgi:hypothetical protein